jgi:hypothetical protein
MFHQQLADGLEFRVHINLRAPGVYAGTAERGIIAFGGDVPCGNLHTDDEAVYADLRFSGEWMPVRIPWSAIVSFLSAEKTAALKAGTSSRTGVN